MSCLIQKNTEIMLFREVMATFKKGKCVVFVSEWSWKLETRDSKIPKIFLLFFSHKIAKIYFRNDDVLFIILLNSTSHKNECPMIIPKGENTFVLLK